MNCDPLLLKPDDMEISDKWTVCVPPFCISADISYIFNVTQCTSGFKTDNENGCETSNINLMVTLEGKKKPDLRSLMA
ncbi:hypothetical protein PAMP_007406 [Pampus punctatissimus]